MLQKASGAEWNSTPAKTHHGMEWHAWLEKGRARDRRKSAAHIKAITGVSIAVLVATAALWPPLLPYDIVARFIVTGAALVLLFQALSAKNYALSVAFGVVAGLYNPVAPAFIFSGDWQRAAVLATVLPFVASLVWRPTRQDSR